MPPTDTDTIDRLLTEHGISSLAQLIADVLTVNARAASEEGDEATAAFLTEAASAYAAI